MQSYIPGHTKMLNCLTYTIMYIHCACVCMTLCAGMHYIK